MNFPAALFVAYSIFDVLPKTLDLIPEPMISYSAAGKGELLVEVSPAQTLGSIPRGASRVLATELNLSASCDNDITVESVTFKHTGLGSTSDVRAIYLLDGTRRVSRSTRFDSRSGLATVRMVSGVIAKCGALKLGVALDFSETAAVGSEHGVSVASSASIVSSAKETTLTEVDSSLYTYTTPYRIGKISVNFLPIRGPLRYGSVETVARIQLSADAAGSHLLKKIILTNTEQAHDMDLILFRLENAKGELLSAPATRMHGDRVIIDFNPTFPLDTSKTVVLLLKAEVRGSNRRGVRFTLEEPSDLVSIPGPRRR